MKFRWTGSIFERNSCGTGVDLKHHPCPNPSDLRLLKLSPVTQNWRSKVAFTRMFRMFQTFWSVLDSFGWCWTVWLEVYSVLHQGLWACFAWPAHRCGLWLFFRMLGDVRRCQAMVGHCQKSLHMTMLRQTPVHERCWRAVDVVHECKLSMARAVPYGDPAGRAICWNLFDFGWALGRFATRSWGALEWWQAKARTSSSHFPRTLTRCKRSFTSKRTGDIWRHLATGYLHAKWLGTIVQHSIFEALSFRVFMAGQNQWNLLRPCIECVPSGLRSSCFCMRDFLVLKIHERGPERIRERLGLEPFETHHDHLWKSWSPWFTVLSSSLQRETKAGKELGS